MTLEGFGERLEKAIVASPLSPRQIAAKCSISVGQLTSYAEENTHPSLGSLKRLACVLNVTTDHLLGLSDRVEVERQRIQRVLVKLGLPAGLFYLDDRELTQSEKDLAKELDLERRIAALRAEDAAPDGREGA